MSQPLFENAPKTFKELIKGDCVFIVDPKDRRIKPLIVDRVEPGTKAGYINLYTLKVEENMATQLTKAEVEIPTTKMINLRENDNSVIVVFTGKTVAEYLPVPVFTSRKQLKQWLKSTGANVLTMPKQ